MIVDANLKAIVVADVKRIVREIGLGFDPTVRFSEYVNDDGSKSMDRATARYWQHEWDRCVKFVGFDECESIAADEMYAMLMEVTQQ